MKQDVYFFPALTIWLKAIFIVFVINWGVINLTGLSTEKAITQYDVTVWEKRQGLPQQSIFAITQTPDGYLWVGTMAGLARFDGSRFKVFTKAGTGSLASDTIRSLFTDRRGILWIGTSDGGISFYQNREFTTYSLDQYPFLRDAWVIADDRSGNLWIGCQEGLVCIKNGQFEFFPEAGGMLLRNVRGLYKDSSGDLWAALDKGITRIIEPGRFETIGTQQGLTFAKTLSVLVNNRQDMWIGTDGGGLIRMENNQFKTYGPDDGLLKKTITSIYKDRSNNLWIGSDGGGLTRKGEKGFEVLNKDNGLACNYVYTIFEDQEKNLWLGTLDRGLHQLRDAKFTVMTTAEGLPGNYITCIYEDKDNGLWIGSSGALCRLKNGRVINTFTSKQGILENAVNEIYTDREGYTWIGSASGLQRLKNGKIETIRKGLLFSSIIEDQHGTMWFGTGDGLFRRHNGITTDMRRVGGLSGKLVRFLFEDSRKRIWVCTEKGISRISDGEIRDYTFEGGSDTNNVNWGYEDKDGIFWFGTLGRLIRMKNGRTFAYSTQHGLPDNSVYAILEDDIGNLWLSGRNGITRVSKKELEELAAGTRKRLDPTVFTEDDGLKSRWCFNGRACKTRDGRLWFPTFTGAAMIDPLNITRTPDKPPVIIEDVHADDVPLDIIGSRPLSLAAGTKRFIFQYTAISFIKPQDIKFRIKLDGFDTDWIDKLDERSATYTRLSPGHYTFRVIAANSDGIWNNEGASFSFYLKPYFYQTVWFYLLVALAAGISIFTGYHIRLKSLITRKKELGKLVDIRTEDLNKRTLELEEANQNLKDSKRIIETKNRQIISSIRYASRIQEAMLPEDEIMLEELKDFFLIYRPRDIVSGDFYWFSRMDDSYYIAVADCTGHGVPGALLSMIGNMVLSEAVKIKLLSDPGLILTALHNGIQVTLNQKSDKRYTFDGMDVALLNINLKHKKVYFAGAKQHLYYIHNPGDKDSAINEIKGSRKSTGGIQKETFRLFTSQEISLESETIIYLRTDGFSDQLNPQGKKFGSPRLKQLLQANAHLDLESQKDVLLDQLLRHQSIEEQTDDITLIGIKLP